MSKIANDGLTWSGTGWMLYSCTHVATVGIKGFNVISSTVNPTIPYLPDDSVVVLCFVCMQWTLVVLSDCIQTISPRVQVFTRVRTCIPYWRALSGGRCRASSATPFQFIFIIDCQPHPTPYCRWPKFSGRRCTCLEQSARSCHFHTFCSSLPVPA